MPIYDRRLLTKLFFGSAIHSTPNLAEVTLIPRRANEEEFAKTGHVWRLR